MDNKNKKLIRNILMDTLKGGFGVVIPTFGMIAIIYFIYNFILDLLSPITIFLNKYLSFPEILTDFIALSIVLGVCFICGVALKTSIGKFVYFVYESFLKKIRVFKIFNTIKEIYLQLTSDNSNAFREFVIVYPVNREAMGVPAFIVESYNNKKGENIFIVFAPTVPNPTSGFSYHLKEEQIDRYPNIPVDKAFRSILSCGAGCGDLIERYSDDKTSL
jgi:uncharacterized membrane protein